MKTAPKYHSSHRKENKSRREFEKLVDPWVVNWTQKDYGVDAFIQTGKPVDKEGSSSLEGTYFPMQLKSTSKDSELEFNFRLEVEKIKLWASANVRVLLVVYQEKIDQFFYKWMDDSLVNWLTSNKPDWSTKKTTSIPFHSSDIFQETSKEEIRRFILRSSSSKKLLPGTYFELKGKIKDQILKFQDIASPFKFESTISLVENLNLNLEQALYRVAVVGPSKVGKSSLINALLRKDISPIGIWQTTGVPIQIVPGVSNHMDVFFKDGSKTSKSFSIEDIEEFASQKFNAGNQKNVKLISVSIVNDRLEKGISFFDIPGLDDPDDEILHDTWNFVRTFNAVIYIIEVSSAASGSFVFRNEYRKNLNEIGTSSEKIFLVLNKTDTLTIERLEELKERIEFDLTRLKLKDKINPNLHYISSNSSFKNRISKSPNQSDPLDNFEKELWEYLLSSNKLGIHRHIVVLNDILKATQILESLIKARLMDSETLTSLRSLIEEVNNKLPNFFSLFSKKSSEMETRISDQLEVKKNRLLVDLESYLKSFPIGQSLPGPNFIRRFLIERINIIVAETNQEYASMLSVFKIEIDNWVENNLKRISELINTSTDTRYFDISPIEKMIVPEIDFSGPFGMSMLGAIFASILNPAALVVGALLGFFGQLIFSAESRRAKKINKVIDASRGQCNVVFNDIQVLYHQHINEYANILRGYSDKKIANFFADVHTQIKAIKSTPLNEEDAKTYKLAFQNLDEFRTEINTITEEVSLYR